MSIQSNDSKLLDRLAKTVDYIELVAKEALRQEGLTEIYGLWDLLYFAELLDYIRSGYDDSDVRKRAYRAVQDTGVAFFNSVMDYAINLEEAPDMSIDGIRALLSDYFNDMDNE